jgi:hypothetical protein
MPFMDEIVFFMMFRHDKHISEKDDANFIPELYIALKWSVSSLDFLLVKMPFFLDEGDRMGNEMRDVRKQLLVQQASIAVYFVFLWY